MIKLYEEFNLFGKKEKQAPKKEKHLDWRKVIEETCHFKSLNRFFNNNCGSNERTFLKYLHKLCFGRRIYVEETKEDFICVEVNLVKGWDNEKQKTTLEVHLKDNKNNIHILPAEGKIHFILPERKVSKIDPYGEENWD